MLRLLISVGLFGLFVLAIRSGANLSDDNRRVECRVDPDQVVLNLFKGEDHRASFGVGIDTLRIRTRGQTRITSEPITYFYVDSPYRRGGDRVNVSQVRINRHILIWGDWIDEDCYNCLRNPNACFEGTNQAE
jgi:hypothetical protein